MISILQRYIAKTILATIFIVLAALCGIQIIFSFVHESGAVGTGNYDTFKAFTYVILTLPSFLQIILPIVCLLGSLMGLGLLANHSELIAMRASSISIIHITKGVFVAAAIMWLFAQINTAYLGPAAKHYANMQKNMAQSRKAVLMTAESIWLKSGNNIVFVGRGASPTILENVIRYKVQDGVLTQILSAKKARYQDSTWQLSDATTIDFASDHTVKQTYRTLSDVDLIKPKFLQVVVLEPDELTALGLNSYIDYRKSNQLEIGSYALQFWQSFTTPLACLVMTMLAVPFVFGPLRSATFGLRLVAGIATGFIFYLLNQFFGSYSLVYGFSPFIGAMVPILIFILILISMIAYISRR